MMWSSMNRLFSGGSDALHMSMSIVAPAMHAGRIAMPSSSATPIPSRPPMNSTLTTPAPAMSW
jgi:hypothetical protein